MQIGLLRATYETWQHNEFIKLDVVVGVPPCVLAKVTPMTLNARARITATLPLPSRVGVVGVAAVARGVSSSGAGAISSRVVTLSGKFSHGPAAGAFRALFLRPSSLARLELNANVPWSRLRSRAFVPLRSRFYAWAKNPS